MEKELKRYTVGAVSLIVVIILLIVFTPIKKLVMPLVLGGVIAYFLRKPVNLLSKKIGRTWAVVVVFGIQAVTFTISMIYLMPVLARQVSELVENLPEYARKAQSFFELALRKLGIADNKIAQMGIEKQIEKLPHQLGAIATDNLKNISEVASSLLLYAFSPIFAFFILKDSKKLIRMLTYLLPYSWRRQVIKTIRQIDTQLWKYVASQLITAGSIAVMMCIGLSVIGIRYAPVLGLITGVLEVIPYFGPFISAVPIVAVASVQGWSQVLWSIVILFSVQQLESLIIAPVIVGNSIKLHPAVVMIVILLGNLLFGIAGMIFAVPIVLAARVTVQNIYSTMIKLRQVKV